MGCPCLALYQRERGSVGAGDLGTVLEALVPAEDFSSISTQRNSNAAAF